MTYDVVLAHDTLVTAVPFVLPALLVTGLLAAIVWRDRREDCVDR